MSYTSQTTVVCDYCGKQETSTNPNIDQVIYKLTQQGWKDYEDTNKQYCSRTCSSNDRRIICDNNGQIHTTP